MAAESIAGAFSRQGSQVALAKLVRERPAAMDLASLADLAKSGRRVIDLRGCAFSREEAAAAQEILGELSDLTFIVDRGEQNLPLTGLGGAALQSSRAIGEDLAAGLAADEEARNWLASLGLTDSPGAGAVGGLGALILAAGFPLLDALSYEIDVTSFEKTARQADLLVVGCSELDFHTKGGPLVMRVAEIAEQALRPVVVLTQRCFVSARELRLAGIEAAYPVFSTAGESCAEVAQLTELADRVARTWAF